MSSSYLTSIGAPQCNFVAIDQQTGEERWRFVLDETCRIEPLLAPIPSRAGDGLLFIASVKTIAALHDVPARPVSNQPLIIALCIGAFVVRARSHALRATGTRMLSIASRSRESLS